MRQFIDFDFVEAVVRAGSIRKAAEDMNITASALNRRINRFERDFGYEIFERLPAGMRLNPAGELLLEHIRRQKSDLARVRSQVADLSGVRRGHVSIACSQALMPAFLPKQISRYRELHPGVTFSVNTRDRLAAEQELASFASDIALVFEPKHMADFEVIAAISQPIHAVMRPDHPLARHDVIRLRDLSGQVLVMPPPQFAVRVLLDEALKQLPYIDVEPVLVSESFDFMSNYVLWEGAVSFQFPIGIADRAGLVTRPVATKDVAPGKLLLGQMRGRTLPVASARFVQQLVHAMHELSGQSRHRVDQT
ncbi:transcriptional regulator of LysR family protein [Candidatus Rhodobacter oscarellae]|uniref:Transcriptional regulator of LysR family protein n=1 Tax=Candidatus Rhodobacter oscarellae TaxID=1675527 RepID=A0A0J9EB03_9RHOB|nr:LysR family transcriptional regulator [Candidatus Rhodobacter lobularis]KMW59957.1 transcriptional regulator of LysR family protein [Candidatus Rhodobacter lobularis]